MIFFYDIRKVLLRAWATDGSPNKYSGKFKVVVVDGFSGKMEYNVDWHDHDAVMEYFGLPD